MKKNLMIVIIAIAVLASVGGYFFLAQKTTTPKTQTVYHVGILSGLNNFAGIADSLKAEMANLGYVEGKNIIYDLQKTNFEPDKEKQILNKFVADKVDLIFGFNTEVALEMKEAVKGTGIPVVFANAFTEGNGLVENLQRPGGNIAGVRYPNTDVAVKRLEILHELVPQAKRIWLPFQKDYPSVAPELDVVRPVAASLNLTLIEFASENLAALQTELKRRSDSGDMGFDAVLLIPESLSTTKAAFEAIASSTRERKIPIGGSRIVTEDYGTFFAVTVDNKEVGVLASRLVDKILKGIPAGTIPVVSPESHIIINYKVAKELGININEGLLDQASEIIR
jgi:putative tryptophan/tyrosine transport system substrate-binding protein